MKNNKDRPPFKFIESAFQFYTYNQKFPTQEKGRLLKTLRIIIENQIEEFGVSIEEIKYTRNDRIKIKLIGEDKDDLIFTSNFVENLLGNIVQAKEIKRGMTFFGFLKDVNKVGFGLFVDVGVYQPEKDVLIPLHQLRKQLNNDETVPLTDIIHKFGFMDHFPVVVEITKAQKFQDNVKLEGKISEDYLEMILGWLKGKLDVVFTFGKARRAVKNVLAKAGHTQDIVDLLRLGPLEMAIVCKKGTSGPGIISHIGQYLPDCKMSSLQASKL